MNFNLIYNFFLVSKSIFQVDFKKLGRPQDRLDIYQSNLF